MMTARITLDKNIKSLSVIRYRVNDILNYNYSPSDIVLSNPLTGLEKSIELRIYPTSLKQFKEGVSAQAYYIAIVSD